MTADNFTTIPFTIDNLDRFIIRTSILSALTSSMVHFKNDLLDVGCGKMPYKDIIIQNSAVKKYIGLDIENALQYDPGIVPDFTWDGITIPFSESSFDTTSAIEVLEHCPEPKVILKEIYRVMKTGGCFFFTVPFLWNLHEVPHDEYRYTPFSLKRLLSECGFKEIDIKATGGWHASMAQMLGLWVRRAPLGDRRRNTLSIILKPIIKKLIKMDRHSAVDFKDGQMITGLYGVAFK